MTVTADRVTKGQESRSPAPRAISRAMVVGPMEPRIPAIVDVGIDAVAGITRQAVAVSRVGLGVAAPLAGLVLRPVRVFRPFWARDRGPVRAEHGRQLRLTGEQQAVEFVSRWLPVIIDRALDRVDVTQLAIDHVAFERIIERIDIVGIARQVIEELDLPEIIRESTGSMASETVVGVRLLGIEADERVDRILKRVMWRRNGRAPSAPTDVAEANGVWSDGAG